MRGHSGCHHPDGTPLRVRNLKFVFVLVTTPVPAPVGRGGHRRRGLRPRLQLENPSLQSRAV